MAVLVVVATAGRAAVMAAVGAVGTGTLAAALR